MAKKYLFPQEINKIIYQSNRVTNATYDFTLIQEKVFNVIMFYLQDAIKKKMEGVAYSQLSLFQNLNPDIICFEIPLKSITKKPQQYPYIIQALENFAGTAVVFPYYDENRKEKRIRFTGLFRGDISLNSKRSTIISIEMEKRVAKILIEIDKNGNGTSINYTKYNFDVVHSARCKYTPRIYKLISSWKIKGQFVMSLNEFRSWLGIQSKYKHYRDVKINVLLPVQKELMEQGDCWFDCEAESFMTKNGKSPEFLNFKIYTKEHLINEDKMKDIARGLLRIHFGFIDSDFQDIKQIFRPSVEANLILNKIVYVQEVINKHSTPVKHTKDYMKGALLKEFE